MENKNDIKIFCEHLEYMSKTCRTFLHYFDSYIHEYIEDHDKDNDELEPCNIYMSFYSVGDFLLCSISKDLNSKKLSTILGSTKEEYKIINSLWIKIMISTDPIYTYLVLYDKELTPENVNCKNVKKIAKIIRDIVIKFTDNFDQMLKEVHNL